ncbi:hypothetical protein QD46_07770 [Paenibacillus polymyxa]|uniref:hypothetical protein n=1 Tax=Paenibacillus polymyxa TaxID=1406 RepID=UPI0005CEF753|nr:hypothetical protein [Paenibacillus polymyxa]KJD40536.1 hypothetical protein QD46_07770 [Paenibacillus polymyxa]
MEHKKAIIEALTLSVNRLGKEKMNEYEKGKIDGLKDAIRLIHMLTSPHLKNKKPIDIIIDDIPTNNKNN